MFRLIVLMVALTASGCSLLYYNFWEALGQEKRDLLKDGIEDVKDGQDDVKEGIEDALSRVRAKYGDSESDLERVYDDLKSSYDNAASEKDRLSNRIDDVEDIAEDLFDEWGDEAELITDKNLRADSLQKRQTTMRRFKPMLAAMREVEASSEPILVKLRDRVLYLKHNLNAQALNKFRSEFKDVESEFESLIERMENATDKADAFIKNLDSPASA